MQIGKLFGTNKKKETEGVFLSLGGGVEIKCKRAASSNKAYAFAESRALKPHARSIQLGNMDPEVLNKINVNLFKNHIVTDWKGVTDKDGNEIPFSQEKFKEFAERYPDFFFAVYALATDMQNFQDDEEAELLGKLESFTDID